MSTADILSELGLDPDAPASTLTVRQHVEIQRRLHERPPTPEWLPTREAARYSRVSAKTLARWADEGLVERRGEGGRGGYRYSVASLDARMASGARG